MKDSQHLNYKEIYNCLLPHVTKNHEEASKILKDYLENLVNANPHDKSNETKPLKSLLAESKSVILLAIEKKLNETVEINQKIELLEILLNGKNLIFQALDEHRHPAFFRNSGEPDSLQRIRAEHKKLKIESKIRENLMAAKLDITRQLEAKFLEMILSADEGFLKNPEQGKLQTIIENWLVAEFVDDKKIEMINQIHNKHPEYIDYFLNKRVIVLNRQKILKTLENLVRFTAPKGKIKFEYLLESCLGNIPNAKPKILSKIFLQIHQKYYINLSEGFCYVPSSFKIKTELQNILKFLKKELKKMDLMEKKESEYEKTYEKVKKYLSKRSDSISDIYSSLEKLMGYQDSNIEGRDKLKARLIKNKNLIFDSISAHFKTIDANLLNRPDKTTEKIKCLEKISDPNNNLICEVLAENSDKLRIKNELEQLNTQLKLFRKIEILDKKQGMVISQFLEPNVADLDKLLENWLIPELSNGNQKEEYKKHVKVLNEIKHEHPEFIDYFIGHAWTFEMRQLIFDRLLKNKDFHSLCEPQFLKYTNNFLESCLNKATNAEETTILARIFQQLGTKFYSVHGIKSNKYDAGIKHNIEVLMKWVEEELAKINKEKTVKKEAHIITKVRGLPFIRTEKDVTTQSKKYDDLSNNVHGPL